MLTVESNRPAALVVARAGTSVREGGLPRNGKTPLYLDCGDFTRKISAIQVQRGFPFRGRAQLRRDATGTSSDSWRSEEVPVVNPRCGREMQLQVVIEPQEFRHQRVLLAAGGWRTGSLGCRRRTCRTTGSEAARRPSARSSRRVLVAARSSIRALSLATRRSRQPLRAQCQGAGDCFSSTCRPLAPV